MHQQNSTKIQKPPPQSRTLPVLKPKPPEADPQTKKCPRPIKCGSYEAREMVEGTAGVVQDFQFGSRMYSQETADNFCGGVPFEGQDASTPLPPSQMGGINRLTLTAPDFPGK
ncbi:hypothetical protein CEXT_406501 [Caerostris extrusa]|uniref:Uncharacterized protein n=1 Tax=Caerostris extrusa TaxID=172846 RepID=A0AAV4MWM0_CAEEX|nr:hypothetical protein CEXT_406501 [Caerostris extrusa]